MIRLPRRLRRTAAQLAVITCPADAAALGLLEPIVDNVELMLRSFAPLTSAGLTAGLAAFEAGAVARYGRPFSRLDPARQRAWFESWWHSPVGPLRAFIHAVKAVLVFGYYEQPAVRERLAFRQDPWIAEVARRRLERYAADIRRHEAELIAPDPLIKSLTRKLRHA